LPDGRQSGPNPGNEAAERKYQERERLRASMEAASKADLARKAEQLRQMEKERAERAAAKVAEIHQELFGRSSQAPPWVQDPRLTNRKRVADLVAINDALKSYRARHGRYPVANSLAGVRERGGNWIPGLSPEFLPSLPRDPAQSDHAAGPEYLYS